VRVVIAICSVLLLAGCLTVSYEERAGAVSSVEPRARRDQTATDVTAPAIDAAEEEQPAARDELTARQETIVAAARRVLATQSTTVGDTTYSYDCTGTILTIYAHAGIYLMGLFPNYSGNGVARLHGIARDYHLLHARSLPEPGDLIFWDNTYDRNQDGNWNDPLTHAGLVIDVDEDGTVLYVHHNYRRGIVSATMNLAEPETYQSPEGAVLNAPMRMASQRAANPDLWLSSHLFREYAAMYRIELSAASTFDGAAVASAP